VNNAKTIDKTDEFTVQIDAKQRELEPWTAKINEKQSLVDVATSERDALAQKATGMQTALQEARASLAALKEGDGSKQQESNDLKREAAKIQKELAAKEANVEVRISCCFILVAWLMSSLWVVEAKRYEPKSQTRVTRSMKLNHPSQPINPRMQYWLPLTSSRRKVVSRVST
jgi:DNA repair exonuclease SbcCD ATPase subunit